MIPRHNPINAITMGGIAKTAGLTPEQFRELLCCRSRGDETQITDTLPAERIDDLEPLDPPAMLKVFGKEDPAPCALCAADDKRIPE